MSWAERGIKILDEVGAERVIAPEVLFDPQLLEMDEWVCYVRESLAYILGSSRMGSLCHTQLLRKQIRNGVMEKHRFEWRKYFLEGYARYSSIVDSHRLCHEIGERVKDART